MKGLLSFREGRGKRNPIRPYTHPDKSRTKQKKTQTVTQNNE